MKALVLGNGRISAAIPYYLKKFLPAARLATFKRESDVPAADLLIGVLPSAWGEEGLRLALKYRKSLVDLADLETGFYLKNSKRIQKSGITVIPGCGFCPGLVNFILGHELFGREKIKSVEVMAGSLSRKKFYFPFLWCFEDLVLEFLNPSWQIIDSKKRKFPAFGGLRREEFFGIGAESYLAQSGFENLAFSCGLKDFTYRNIRPEGFREFFLFMDNYGMFSGANLAVTKRVLESRVEDNYSLARIIMSGLRGKKSWNIRSFAAKNERFNSMQKITASFAAQVSALFLSGRICGKGLFFCEDIGCKPQLFREAISGMRKIGVEINEKKSI